MPAILTDKAFNPWDEIQAYQAANLQPGQTGATACFVGTMRDFNISEDISRMTLEHYPAMTQRFLDRLCDETVQQFELNDCLVIHRFGEIRVGEPIVLTTAWSAHRKQAFAACRHLIEELKKHAPFWKKETTEKGERWVHNDQ